MLACTAAPVVESSRRTFRCSARYGTQKRSKNRSKSASSSSPSGSSLLAPTNVMSGQARAFPSSWKTRSFMSVSRAFRIALEALKVSSTNATCASGSLPAVTR